MVPYPPKRSQPQQKEQIGFALDKKKMQLEEPIRSLGYHDVPIRLHTKVTGTLRVKVTEE